ncbi:MAG: DNA (cytosine-5-)-methyltransferase, partial [Cyanobacteria bacterium 13_1_40CM_2_61_4]
MTQTLAAVDLFCGAGGLTSGLIREGIPVLAGVDLDPEARYPFEFNNGSAFIEADVGELSGHDVRRIYPPETIRILVGCAPCQPFSSFTQSRDAEEYREWSLLDSFSRIVEESRPAILSMENVTQLRSHAVFSRFVRRLRELGYWVNDYDVRCSEYGVPQRRTRLVLFASLFGPVEILRPTHRGPRVRTVRDAIESLPEIEAGESSDDPLHRSCRLTAINLRRIRASHPGGSW